MSLSRHVKKVKEDLLRLHEIWHSGCERHINRELTDANWPEILVMQKVHKDWFKFYDATITQLEMTMFKFCKFCIFANKRVNVLCECLW